MRHVVSLFALVVVAMGLAACGAGSVSSDMAYFKSHASDRRVQSCFATSHYERDGTPGASEQSWMIVGAPALHRAVLCMQRRLARQ
jgi:hypothetical protein